MDISRYVFFLGADDPEMQRIVEILELLGAFYFFAQKDGERVHPGNAGLICGIVERFSPLAT